MGVLGALALVSGVLSLLAGHYWMGSIVMGIGLQLVAHAVIGLRT